MEVSFSSKDLCRIIETASKANVSTIKIGNLEVSFLPKSLPTIEDLSKTHSDAVEQTSSPEQKVSMTPVEKDLLEEARTSQLMVDDPLAFEQEIIDGFMGRNRTYENEQNA